MTSILDSLQLSIFLKNIMESKVEEIMEILEDEIDIVINENR